MAIIVLLWESLKLVKTDEITAEIKLLIKLQFIRCHPSKRAINLIKLATLKKISPKCILLFYTGIAAKNLFIPITSIVVCHFEKFFTENKCVRGRTKVARLKMNMILWWICFNYFHNKIDSILLEIVNTQLLSLHFSTYPEWLRSAVCFLLELKELSNISKFDSLEFCYASILISRYHTSELLNCLEPKR